MWVLFIAMMCGIVWLYYQDAICIVNRERLDDLEELERWYKED